MKRVSLALVGAGCRGKDVYAAITYKEKLNADFVAVVDPVEEKRLEMVQRFGMKKDMAFEHEEDFFSKGKVCDGVVIATQDKDHYRQCMKALDLGYDIVLEKPISNNLKEVLEIEAKAKASGCKIIVCHVLRYHNMWNKIKKVLDSGQLGKVISIQHNENVGHYHMSHSFVRGEWRDSETSGPIMLTKTCHDFDILYWLVGSPCKSVASFGGIGFFNREHAPAGAGERCLECKVAERCKYNAMDVYTHEGGYTPQIFTNNKYTREAIEAGLQTTNYGQCVFKAGNTVCDHQSTILEFENGVSCTFNLNAFTRESSRTIKIMCEKGTIRANEANIEVIKFKMRHKVWGEVANFLGWNRSIMKKIKVHSGFSIKNLLYGHGGADYYFTAGMVEALSGEVESKTDITDSVESHLMAFAAEEARESHRVVDIKAFRESMCESL